MATEEPQLNSIQERIAALRQSQAAHPAASEPPSYPRPPTERSRSANNPPSYHVTGSVLDTTPIANNPADERTSRPNTRPPPPPTPSPKPDLKPKPKVPPPLPTKRERAPPPPPPSRGDPPPSYAESRPALPPRRPTDQQRRPSIESVTSDASHSTAATTATSIRGASTTSVNSTGTANGRIKAPAWGETTLPALPPKRPKEDPIDIKPPPRSDTKSSSTLGNLSGGLSAKFNSIRGKSPAPSSSSASSRPSIPSRPSLPSRPSASSTPTLPSRPQTNGNTPPVPQLPPRRPSGVEGQSNGANGVNSEDEPRPSLPARRLPPTPSATDLNNIRKTGFGDLKSGRSSSTPAGNPIPNGTPPPIPHGSRPDLSKILATKPRMNGSSQPVAPVGTSDTCCLVCRDFSAPDQRAEQYPRETLPSHDIGWLANELTAPFPSATDKARVIFKWLHHNIIYDTYSFFNNCVKPSTPASTIASGLAVCEGFAGLFAALATKAGLEAVVVSGHGKGYGHEELAAGAAVPPFKAGHAWNAVRIDGGQWKLIDPCWGGGHLCQASGGKYKQEFHPREFTMPNDEFGLKHFPSNKEHFFRDDGRPEISWEEYMRTNPDNPAGGSPIKFYNDADKNDIGRSTLRPADGRLSVYSMASPVRFQFGLVCEHWTLAHHSRMKPALFFLNIKGIDGRKDQRLPFHYVLGSGPGGGGAFWYVDVPDARMLGAPGQKVLLCILTKFGDRTDCRGVTRDEYLAREGRVGMSWAYVAEWELVR